ncbi:MAG: hypothetical protein M1834_005197 [Cirrosporium novae-zelandiae]|nr:MAG: hypothetical protein M1834_005197 [Cirrosporium novae-zelandiae]
MLLSTLPSISVSFLILVSLASAKIHHLFVGTFEAASLYALEFDDEALTLKIASNISAYDAHSWIAFDHNKKNLYGVAGTAFSSYSVLNGTSLSYDTSLEMGGNCSSDSTTKNIFVTASPSSPYTVYGTPFGGAAYCGTVMSVSSTGALSTVIQNYTYTSTSGVHGLALSPNSKYLYSADDSGNAIWTHRVNNETGTLTFLSKLSGPTTGADPRHVATHPSGTHLYAILEGTNQLAVYSLSQSTGLPTNTTKTYSLIPLTVSNSSHWSDEVALSASSKYLWATSRARETSGKGYISVFSLSEDGAVEKQLLLEKTSSSGGTANSVAPAGFSDEWAALTDSSTGFVQVWRLGGNATGSGVQAAEPVARVNITEGGCCANVLWYD